MAFFDDELLKGFNESIRVGYCLCNGFLFGNRWKRNTKWSEESGIQYPHRSTLCTTRQYRLVGIRLKKRLEKPWRNYISVKREANQPGVNHTLWGTLRYNQNPPSSSNKAE